VERATRNFNTTRPALERRAPAEHQLQRRFDADLRGAERSSERRQRFEPGGERAASDQ
jgi:hypothetical protein